MLSKPDGPRKGCTSPEARSPCMNALLHSARTPEIQGLAFRELICWNPHHFKKGRLRGLAGAHHICIWCVSEGQPKANAAGEACQPPITRTTLQGALLSHHPHPQHCRLSGVLTTATLAPFKQTQIETERSVATLGEEQYSTYRPKAVITAQWAPIGSLV